MMDYLNSLNDDEYKIIEILNEDNKVTQRHIAEKAGISLGMTNIIIRRLINKGFIKIRNMNKKRILYHLTPKAIIEKTQRTYNYFERTVKDILSIREKIQNAILTKINGNYTEIIIAGRNEMSEIAKWAVQVIDRSKIKVSFRNQLEESDRSDILTVNCETRIVDNENYINVFKII
ncbi:MAG: winged helix-turn-helix transcriptional regulator [bacterium]|nr:winged helix-turn-helix transcriptional regulator [bacterium]